MPIPLRESIEGPFSRKQNRDFVPKLDLIGFQQRQNLKFPAYWNIKSELWDDVESRDEI